MESMDTENITNLPQVLNTVLDTVEVKHSSVKVMVSFKLA